MEYPKINSLWKREGWYFDEEKKKDPKFQKGRQSLIEGDYACEEFGSIKRWRVDEKVDGTNIRIFYEEGKVSFGGRTSKAQIPKHLLKYLEETFTRELMNAVFPDNPKITLFGEGYGPKIQACGGNYRSEPGFILFDIVCGGWWLKKEDVEALAEKLGILTVPSLGVMEENDIVDFVRSMPMSRCSRVEQQIEGVVCRSEPLMLFRNSKPLMFKLKCREFKKVG